MGIPILVYGKSGSGKSRSLKEFGEDEIFLVNVQRKPLPFRKKFQYVYNANPSKKGEIQKICKALYKMPTKSAVIDDAGYLMTAAFMAGHSAPRSGSSSFDLYNDIADGFWSLINFVLDLPEEKIVYLMMHETTSDYGETKLRTIGKLLDDKVCLEGMVSICLRCMTDGTRHYFLTQSSGRDVSKSPEGMFPDVEIENDLKMVDDAIRAYYGLNDKQEAKA